VTKSNVEKLADVKAHYRRLCPRCGCAMHIYPFEHVDKKPCRWCGYYVFISEEKQEMYEREMKKQAFRKLLKEELIKREEIKESESIHTR
jgi:DNA-directed RNA polymerase subunit M/transcription elongation factor TFIIS